MKNYYNFLMIFSFALFITFILLGFNGILSPFPALTGVICSVAGIIGTKIDMRDKGY